MTTTPAAPAAPAPVTREPAVPAGRAGFGHLLISEWTKLRSVRSTVWTLIAFVVVTVGLTVLISLAINGAWNGPRAASRNATVIADPVGAILGLSLALGQLTICVLGVMVITTEYSTGVIRASLLAVPRRLPMLVAKAVVFAVLIIVLAEIIVIASFFVGTAILHSHVSVSLGDPGVTRSVLGAGLYLTVLGLFALGVGGLIRHTAGGVSAVIGIVLVLPIIGALLPSGTVYDHLNAYLPTNAGQLVAHVHRSSGDLLGPWQGFGVLCLYAAIALVAAGILLRRRDA
ncbi:MAG TPA: ABC transporter permease [Streptosporangiaceae bacterium]|nr:ABC transporter permease [Streptosporangiaceae bacterium]